MTDLTKLDIALRLAGFNFKKPTLDLIQRTMKAVEEKGGELTVEDIENIEASIDAKYFDEKQL